MSRIYSSAVAVLAWVGESDEGSNAVFDLITETDTLRTEIIAAQKDMETETNAISNPPPSQHFTAHPNDIIEFLSQREYRALSGENGAFGYVPISVNHRFLDSETSNKVIATKKLQIPGHEEFKADLINFKSILETDDQVSSWLLKSIKENSKWLSLLAFLNRPYFHCVWILQELYFAGDLRSADHNRCLIVCGHRYLRLPTLYKLWKYLEIIEISFGSYELHGYAWLFGNTTEVDEPLRSLVEFGPLHGQSKAPSIFNVLEDAPSELSSLIFSTILFKATDPKDKIYALLNIAMEYVDIPEFKVDYTKSVSQVLKEVVLYVIEAEGTLEILEGNRLCTDRCKPSWIPESSILPVKSYEWEASQNFSASRDLRAYPRLDSLSNILHLQGVPIANVTIKFGPFIFGQQFYDEHLIHLKQYFQSASRRKRELLWRTLVMDTDRTNILQRESNSPAPTEFGLMCAVFFDLAQPPQSYCPMLAERSRRKRYVSGFLTNMYDSAQRRCIFETRDGWIGLGPENTQPGDLAIVLFDGKVCFMLRPKGPHFQLVGDCYVQNAMHGQLITVGEHGNVHNECEIALC